MSETVENCGSAAERLDPRIRRTKQMLFHALETLLAQRSIEDLTVADIASHADLNRGTFYDHFPDKFALLEGLVESNFQKLLHERNVHFDGTCAYALTSVTLATCDYLATMPNSSLVAHQRVTEKHLECAISSVIRVMVLGGLKRHYKRDDFKPKLISASIAGAIFGAARQWAADPDREPAETVGSALLGVFKSILDVPESELIAGSQLLEA